MGEVKHTPGPWIFFADLPSTGPNWHVVTTANKMRVIANVHIDPGSTMDQVNANLIAAAPDLLEALQKCEALLSAVAAGLNREPSAVTLNARAVIAKAKGRA